MKFTKRLAIIIAIIIAIPLIVAIFTKKDYSVEREVTINKPSQDVFNYIKMLKNQPNYSVWNKKDPDAKMDYRGTDGTVGFVAAWDSEKVGRGEQEITKIADGQRMDVSMHFMKPMDGKATAYFTTEPVTPTQTKVKWVMNGEMKYPMNFMMLVMNMDKMLGGQLGEGLANLKNVLEK